jgi:DNA processing protein
MQAQGTPIRDALQRDLEWVQAHASNTRIVHWDSEDYPALLREITDPPPVLFVQGDAHVLQHPQIALVGSRQATHAGLEDAFRFARELAEHGICVSSGLARGIDAAAHRGALAGKGFTLGVMATGPDTVYPSSHAELASAICDQGGALVTEFPPGTAPHAAYFPRRNRIISGLSMGVLVVQATLKSGTLITARLAMEQGREVFAIPGSIHQPQSRGCHRLIRDGAALVETVDDILAELGGFQSLAVTQRPDGVAMPPGVTPELQAIMECIEFHPTPIDTIVARSQLDSAQVLSRLTELEIEGRIVSAAGGFARLPRS